MRAFENPGMKQDRETVTLYCSKEDDGDVIRTFSFTVTREWLEEYLEGNSVEEFLEEYNSDDTMVMYAYLMLGTEHLISKSGDCWYDDDEEDVNGDKEEGSLE